MTARQQPAPAPRVRVAGYDLEYQPFGEDMALYRRAAVIKGLARHGVSPAVLRQWQQYGDYPEFNRTPWGMASSNGLFHYRLAAANGAEAAQVWPSLPQPAGNPFGETHCIKIMERRPRGIKINHEVAGDDLAWALVHAQRIAEAQGYEFAVLAAARPEVK